MYTPFHLQDRWNSILPRSKHLLSALDTRKKKKKKEKEKGRRNSGSTNIHVSNFPIDLLRGIRWSIDRNDLFATLSRIFTPAADEHGDTTWRFGQEQLFAPLPATLSLSLLVHGCCTRKNRNDFAWKKKRSIGLAWTPGRMFPGMIRDRRN